MRNARSGPVVVGVSAGTPDRVLDEAVSIARDLRVPLACVYVDESRVPIGETPDGTVVTAPVAAAGHNERPAERLAPALATISARIVERAVSANVTVTHHTLAGDPVTAIARFAVDRDARLIVVGTRQPGVRASLSLLLAGPVASRLARRQPVPVLVVPLHDRTPLPAAARDEKVDAETDVPDPADVLFGEGHA
ncbi:universal stress protein [Gryllotalpicola protaetiae]|nr:universal stress protein [Gryllotalpicola protaetiae]